MARRSRSWACATAAVAILAPVPPARAGVAWTPFGPPGARTLIRPADSSSPVTGEYAAAVAVDPSDDAHVYAATVGGLFVSRDAGGSWTYLPAAGLADAFGTIGKIVVDPAVPSTVYALSRIGLFKSTDGGGTISPTSLTTEVLDFAIDPAAPATFYALTVMGVLRSTDGGATWRANGTTPFQASAIAVGGSSAVYLAADKLYRSTNGGATWSPTAVPGPVYLVATPPDGSDTVYAWSGVLQKSLDGGATYETLHVPGAGTQVVALTFDPHDPQVVYVLTGAALLKSPDGGATWTNLTAHVPGSPGFTSVAVDARDPRVLYLGTANRAVIKSTDGGVTWTPLGVDAETVSLIVVHPTFPTIVFAQNRAGFFRSTNAGATWTQVNVGARVQSIAFDSVDPREVYAGLEAAGAATAVNLSLDYGATWRPTTALPVQGAPSVASVVAVDPNRPGTLYAGIDTRPYFQGYLYRSPDRGTTWESRVVFPAQGLTRGVLSLLVDPARAGLLYAGTYQGVFTSDDAGDTWTAANAGIEQQAVFSLVQDSRSSTLYAATATAVQGTGTFIYYVFTPTGVMKRAADGTWTAATTGLPSLDVHQLTPGSADGSLIFAATGGGVALTRDAAAHWESGGLPLPTITVAVDRVHPNVLYAGTDGHGAYRADVTPCTSAAECDDGDPCTADVCDPASAVGDLDGCVRDRTGFGAVGCRLHGMTEALECGDFLKARIRRRVVATLSRASNLVRHAGKHRRGRKSRLARAVAALQRVDRILTHRSGMQPPDGYACIVDLGGRVKAFVDQVRALQ